MDKWQRSSSQPPRKERAQRDNDGEFGEGDTGVALRRASIYLLRVGVNKLFFFLILEMLQPVTSNYL